VQCFGFIRDMAIAIKLTLVGFWFGGMKAGDDHTCGARDVAPFRLDLRLQAGTLQAKGGCLKGVDLAFAERVRGVTVL